MSLAPYDLNANASHVEILKAAGVSVKGIEPESVTCPICKNENSLGIWRDYLSTGVSRWMHCRSCGWHGDALEIYAYINHLDIEEAVKQASTSGCLSMPPEELSAVKITGYKNGYIDYRRRQESQWSLLSKNMFPMTNTIRERMTKGMWALDAPNFEGFRGVLGGALRSEVSKAFGKEVLPRKGFSIVYAIRYQDVPGRTCAIKFVGDNGSHFYAYPEPSTNVVEGGLTWLHTLESHEDVVYALDNDDDAMLLLNRYLLGRSKPLKVVSYNEATRVGWHSVNANKVYLRATSVNGGLFNQMKQVNNVHITTYPEISTEQLARKLSSAPPNVILDQIAKYAKPGYRFFAEWLTNDRTQHEIVEFRNSAKLDDADKHALMDACIAARRPILEACLGTRPATKTVVQRGKTIVERAGQWFIVHKDCEERITNATPIVEQQYGDAATGKLYQSGHISFNGRNIAFREQKEVIEKDPKAWIEALCIKAGIGAPVISNTWRKDLLEIALKMHDPTYVSSLKRLGFESSTGSILFPRFTMTHGNFEEDLNYISGPGAPADNIIVPAEESRDTMHQLVDEVDPTLAGTLAAMAAVTANILSPLHGWSIRPICVVPRNLGAPRKALKILSEIIDAPLREATSLTGAEIMAVYQDARDNHWPHIVSVLKENLNGLGTQDNVICNATPLEALTLQAGGARTVFVTVDNAIDDPPGPCTADWLHWLKDLQLRGYPIEKGADLASFLLADLCAWWAQRYDRIAQRLYAGSKVRLKTAYSTSEAFISLYIELYKRGHLEILRKPFVSDIELTKSIPALNRRVGIVIDESKNAVLLVRSRLMYLLGHLALPTIETLAAEKALSNASVMHASQCTLDGWVISLAEFRRIEAL